MRRKLAPVLVLCALVTSNSVSRAQNGPDNDADGAPGYVQSVFHHGEVDSINMYNGQLTVPIALGPSYPVGPKLRVQVALTYNSRSTDYGAPSTLEQSPYFYFRPLAGNPSLGSGWELTLGAIKTCKHGQIVGNCYFAGDGSQHMFGGRAEGERRVAALCLALLGPRSLRHVGRRRKSLRLRNPRQRIRRHWPPRGLHPRLRPRARRLVPDLGHGPLRELLFDQLLRHLRGRDSALDLRNLAVPVAS